MSEVVFFSRGLLEPQRTSPPDGWALGASGEGRGNDGKWGVDTAMTVRDNVRAVARIKLDGGGRRRFSGGAGRLWGRAAGGATDVGEGELMNQRRLLKRRPLLLALGAVLLLAAVAAAICLPNHPLRSIDKAEAVRRIVAWIVQNKSLPGFADEYPDARWMTSKKRFFVVCDFLPADTAISPDPRVVRIAAAEYDDLFRKHRYNDTDYLVIKLTEDLRDSCTLEVSNMFGSLGGHGYQFVLHRKLWGIRLRGKFLWVS